MKFRSRLDPTQMTEKTSQVVAIPFELHSIGPAGTSACPVSGGLYLLRGQIFDISAPSVRNATESTVTQTDILSRRSDGSIRWVLVSWIAVPNLHSVSGSCQLDSALKGARHDPGNSPRMMLRRRM